MRSEKQIKYFKKQVEEDKCVNERQRRFYERAIAEHERELENAAAMLGKVSVEVQVDMEAEEREEELKRKKEERNRKRRENYAKKMAKK